MKRVVLVLLTIFSLNNVWATPEQVEIIFLSEPKTSFFKSPFIFTELTAQNDWQKDCIPQGDGCFHPQLGYIEKEGPKKPVAPTVVGPQKTFNSADVDLVECREGEYFDIFCGKASKEKKKNTPVEIWVDTSASLRKMDFSTDPSRCVRRSFVESVVNECGDKVSIQVYDTSIKSLATMDGLCQSYGTNDVSRLIKWIKASQVKYLFIITDIDELSTELRDFLDSIGAKYHGSGVKDFTVKDLQNYVSVVKKQCQ